MREDIRQEDSSGSEKNTSSRDTQADGNDYPAAAQEQASQTHSEQSKSFRQHWNSSTPLNRWTFVFTGIIAVATLFYAGFSGWQLIEIHKSSADTHMLAVAASEQADTNKMLLKGQFSAFVRAGLGGAFRNQSLIVNVGFDNEGKIKTRNSARYRITLITLPDERVIRTIGTYMVADLVPSEGESPMPNHYYTISHFTGKDLALYRNFSEGFRVEGHFRYDDGFGETINSDFCLINSGFTNYTCQNILLLLPPKPHAKRQQD